MSKIYPIEKIGNVIQHNNLVEAHYKLGLQEKRLVLWLASQVQRDDDEFKVHTISISEFSEVINIDKSNAYKELPKITKKLMQKIIQIRSLEKNELLQVAWLNSARYQFGEGKVTLRFSSDLKPFLLQIQDRFTKTNLKDLMRLKSVYAIRVYELLKQYETVGKRKTSLDELRAYCGIGIQQYKRFNDFKKDIIEISKREINAKTDIIIDYREVKESRKIVAIEWTIRKQEEIPLRETENVQTNFMSSNIKGATPIKIQALLNIYGSKEVAFALEELQKHPKKSNFNYLEGILKNRRKENEVYEPKTPLTIPLIFEDPFSTFKKCLADKIGHPAYKSWFIDNGVEFVLQESGLFPTFSSQRVADHILLNYRNAMDKTWEETKDIYTGNV
jgi:plasmid replication initiation protein